MEIFWRITLILIFTAFLFIAAACSRRAADAVPYAYTHTPEPSPVAAVNHPPETTPQPAAPIPSPTPPPPERRIMHTPYLVRLEPYQDGLYTDGMNTFQFMEDGTVQARIWDSPRTITLGTKSPPARDLSALRDTDDFRLVSEMAASYMEWEMEWGEHWGERFQIIHEEDGYFFIHKNNTHGGGSGESYVHAEEAYFFRVNANGSIVDLSHAVDVHIIWHDGYFYFVELAGGIFWTHGTGKIVRVDMNGGGRTYIVDELTIGPFQIIDERIFFSDLYGVVYSVDLDGNDRAAVCDRIAPTYHRPGLAFYGSTIINRFWGRLGYGFGTFVLPNELTRPAIMCRTGRCLITFPEKLTGRDPYTVIVWGYERPEEIDNPWASNTKFLILRSNRDGSYWVYSRRCLHEQYPYVFRGAREQLSR